MNRLPRVPGFLGLAALALPVAAPALAQQEAGGLEEVVQAAVEVINRDYEFRKGTPD